MKYFACSCAPDAKPFYRSPAAGLLLYCYPGNKAIVFSEISNADLLLFKEPRALLPDCKRRMDETNRKQPIRLTSTCGFALTGRTERDNMKLTEYTSRFLPPTFLMPFSESEGPVRKFLPAVLSWSVTLLALLVCVGCIAHQPGSGGGGGSNGPTVVTVSPTSASVSGAATLQFTATVTPIPNQNVTWNVNGVQGGNATVGTILATGVYTAPVPPPTPNTVSITATSQADGTVSAAATVTITPSQVAVSLAAASGQIGVGATDQITATVTGTTNTTVAWYVNNILGGNSTFGTIANPNSNLIAVYTAPPTVPANTTVTITATSQANPAVTGTANVSIVPIVITISPSPASVAAGGGTQQFTASVTGATNPSVSWSVSPNANCPATNVGSINASNGLYTAPPWIPQPVSPPGPCPVTITATATVGGTAYPQTAVADVHISVSINGPPNDPSAPPPNTIGLGANWQYTATITGADPSNPLGPLVNWRTSSAQANAGTFDKATGFYTAPSVPPLVAATIYATSQFDSTQATNTTLTIQGSDPLGTITTPSELSCGGNSTLSSTATCYQTTVSCPGISDISAYLKVNTPSGSPQGTVLFGVGSGGSGLYDDPNSAGYTYGYQTINDILTAASGGFNTVQISFGIPFNSSQPNGWLQGPGGVRRLACRYATLADWIYNNPSAIALKLPAAATTSAPMCATGNSGGSGAIAYAVSGYGRGPDFAMIEPTSGPPMALLNQGCSPCFPSGSVCVGSTLNTANLCYAPADAAIIDTAYQSAGATTPTVCTDALNGNPGTDAAAMFVSDSILSTQANPSLAATKVNLLFGDDDPTNAVPQGMSWGSSITPASTHQCLVGVDHGIPNFEPGAPPLSSGQQSIANDIITMCK